MKNFALLLTFIFFTQYSTAHARAARSFNPIIKGVGFINDLLTKDIVKVNQLDEKNLIANINSQEAPVLSSFDHKVKIDDDSQNNGTIITIEHIDKETGFIAETTEIVLSDEDSSQESAQKIVNDARYKFENETLPTLQAFTNVDNQVTAMSANAEIVFFVVVLAIVALGAASLLKSGGQGINSIKNFSKANLKEVASNNKHLMPVILILIIMVIILAVTDAEKERKRR